MTEKVSEQIWKNNQIHEKNHIFLEVLLLPGWSERQQDHDQYLYYNEVSARFSAESSFYQIYFRSDLLSVIYAVCEKKFSQKVFLIYNNHD